MSKNLYTRNGIFWARFKVRGQRYAFSLHTRNERIAVKAMNTARAQIEAQVWHGEAAPVSWEAAVVEWAASLPRLGIKGNTVKRYLVSIGRMEDWLLGVDLHKIDAKLMKRIISDRSKRGVSNATIRRDLTAVSSVLGVAVDNGWIEENPAKMIDRSRVKEKREPITLPTKDALAVVFATPGRFMDMASFALETGMRQDEIATLTNSQIDAARCQATLTRTKTSRARVVPLSPKAMEIIAAQPRHIRGAFVFWRGDGEAFKNVSAQFYASCNRALQKVRQSGQAFERFRFHDLRHLFAVEYLRERRGTLYDLQQVLGHTSVKTTEGYLDHLSPDERRDAVHGVLVQEVLQKG